MIFYVSAIMYVKYRMVQITGTTRHVINISTNKIINNNSSISYAVYDAPRATSSGSLLLCECIEYIVFPGFRSIFVRFWFLILWKTAICTNLQLSYYYCQRDQQNRLRAAVPVWGQTTQASRSAPKTRLQS